ncbi:MAG: branched-chain amino acid ABC transporter permease [Cyanobacteria bacterium QS_5_48_63]|nr:MAG: branched-chain amino acid ABC transporter permease [Cyanobacteria bacterium QS_5_48_63]
MADYAGYLVYLTISTGLFGLFALGLNLQWGFTGLINFGHVAFMTVGAYATVLLSSQGVPIIIAAIAGVVLAALLGLLIGTSTLRLREDYLAIVTIGVSEFLRLVVQNEEWLTQGSFGVQSFPLPLVQFSPNPFGKGVMIAILTLIAALAGWRLWRGIFQQGKPIDLLVWGVAATTLGLLLYLSGAVALLNYTYKAGLMLLVLIALALVYGGLESLVRSPWGRVLKAIREDEQVPLALGKDVFWYKLQAFMLGGAIAGIAGAFYAWQLTTVYPTNFEPLISFYAWTIVLLGGAGNNAGTLLGAVIFWAYDSLTRFVLPQFVPLDDARLGAFRIMIIGLILMVLMVWRPQGILGRKEELTLGR